MAPRGRSQVLPRPKGSWGRFGQTFGGGSQNVAVNNCSDQTGPGDCAPFEVLHYDSQGGVINQDDSGSPWWMSWFQDYAADILDNWDNFPHHTSLEGDKSDVAFATETAARTNPSRPYVDVPVNVLQLGEITRLIRDTGRGMLSQVGSGNLKYQFGIAPLAGDLARLCYFQDQVSRRVSEIERLRSPKGLRRTVGLGEYSANGHYFKYVQSQGTFIAGDFFANTTLSVRGHARWIPSVSVEHLSPDAMRALARRAVLGLTGDLSTAWELIPWSWLIDWGTTIGDFLQANRNIIPATLLGVHVMRHTRTEYRFDGWDWGYGNMTPIHVTRSNKYRAPSYIAPVAHFPFLSGSQVGILASLAVTRM